jgi:hypothetical protein
MPRRIESARLVPRFGCLAILDPDAARPWDSDNSAARIRGIRAARRRVLRASQSGQSKIRPPCATPPARKRLRRAAIR